MIQTNKLARNARSMLDFCRSRGVELTGVTKGVCGSPRVAGVFLKAGIRSLGDSRIVNLRRLRECHPDAELMLIRSPVPSEIPQVVALADASVNTELDVILELGAEAVRQGRVHNVLVMVELGDLREGIAKRELVPMVDRILRQPGVRLQGVGANLACLSGAAPSESRMQELSLLSETLESSLGVSLQRVSGGNSSNYQWMLSASDLGRINHVRVGESILLGRDSLTHAMLEGFETDAFSLVSEVIEVKERRVEGKAMRRALLALGRLDSDLTDLQSSAGTVVGGTSDHLVVDVTENPVRVGDQVAVSLGYRALSTAMVSPYVEKVFLDEGVA